MTRDEFLTDPAVCAMLPWLSDRSRRDDVWTHTYVDRKTGAAWHCGNLYDAFEKYAWNGAEWKATKDLLDGYRVRLRISRDRNDTDEAYAACEDVLRWGGVWAKNGTRLGTIRPHLLDELRHMSSVLEAGATPTPSGICRLQGESTVPCRMNAGFVKIYSVLLDHCVIYDGRVGAALGLLVRQFCEQTGRASVPAPLTFAYGLPKEGNPAAPKKRNPSAGDLRFPQLRAGDSRGHVDNTIRANWLLKTALERGRGAFTPGEDGFHELAAALFMVGYDLSEAALIEPAASH